MAAVKIQKKVLLVAPAAMLLIAAVLLVPAGTIYYWQAWAYMAVVFIPFVFVVAYFLKYDPEFLARRMQTREREARQKLIIKLGMIPFTIGFIIPGLDYRFGWSTIPAGISIAADVVVFLSYFFIFLVFRENSFAGRTIKVVKGQKVISTGPYAFIRHPMYLGVSVMYLATPIALGSYWALPFFLCVIPIIVFRIFNEEEVLKRELKGYKEYCKKVKYRLIPFVW